MARIVRAGILWPFHHAAPTGAHFSVTILLVDDDQPFLDMLRAVFEEAGLRVRCAFNVSDALKLAAEHPIDGALTDYEMPPFDGLQFCREFRRETTAAGRPAPVWVMTGSITLTPEQALAAGAETVFRKPFSAIDVAREIQQRLRWTPTPNAAGIGSAGHAGAGS